MEVTRELLKQLELCVCEQERERVSVLVEEAELAAENRLEEAREEERKAIEEEREKCGKVLRELQEQADVVRIEEMLLQEKVRV